MEKTRRTSIEVLLLKIVGQQWAEAIFFYTCKNELKGFQ